MFQKCSILLCCIKTALHQRKSFAEHLRHLHAFAFFSLTSFRIGFNSCIGSSVCTVHSAVGLKLTALRNSIKSLNHIGQCHVWYSDTALTLAGPLTRWCSRKKGCKLNWKLSVSSCQNQQSSFTLSQAECHVCYNIKCGYLFNVTAGAFTVCLRALPPAAAAAVNIVKVSLVKLISDTLCLGPAWLPAWLSVCLKCGCGLRLTAQL